MSNGSHDPLVVESDLVTGPSWITSIDRLLQQAVDVPVAILVVIEIGVLSVGVVARYVFHSPLIWSDELATILFMWLSMLGAASAFGRLGHMRMTAMLSAGSPSVRACLEMLAIVASLVFLIAIIQPAYEFAADEGDVTTPVLGISNAWRAAAFPIGTVIMFVMGVLQILKTQQLRPVLIALAIMAMLTAIFALSSPILMGLGRINLIIFFVVLFAIGIFAGVPIGFTFSLVTVFYLTFATSIPNIVVVGRMNEGMSHPALLAVPLFVFLGQLMQMTGMATVMVNFLASLLGHVRGGLSYVLIGAMYLVSGISGSKIADMAAVAPALFPEMTRRGSKPGDLVALLSATGAQTEIIPPSIVLITVGTVTNVSIAALFTGGLLPGFVLAVSLAVMVWWQFRTETTPLEPMPPLGTIGRLFVIALPALALPFIIRSAVIEGVATATEVSTIGIIYSVLIGIVIYRRFDWSLIMPMLIETAALSGAILFIIGAASAMAWALTQSGFSSFLAEMMTGLPGGKFSFLAVSIVAFIILGTVLEGIPAMVLFGPLLFPIARTLGVDEVHYAIVVITAMGIGLFAPPFGMCYYAACAIGKINPDLGIKPLIRYMIALTIGTIILAAVPWITTGFL